MTGDAGGALGANLRDFTPSDVAHMPARRTSVGRYREHDEAKRKYRQPNEFESEDVHGNSPKTNRKIRSGAVDRGLI